MCRKIMRLMNVCRCARFEKHKENIFNKACIDRPASIIAWNILNQIQVFKGKTSTQMEENIITGELTTNEIL